MRFLVRRIYRAFPELDRYSDEQCLRFVRATKRRLWTRLGHRIVIGVVTLLAIGGACALCAYISERIDSYQNSVRRDVLWVELGAALVCVPMVAIASVAGFIARDLLLRRRLRYVLRTRSACPGCGYGLIGLSVSAGHTITCPECGLVCEVDPSLRELTLGEGGKELYVPSIIAPPRPKFLTARRRRLAVLTLLVIVLVPGLVAGSYEIWLRHQASVARRERPGAAGLMALAESVQPAGAEGDTRNAWDLGRLASAAVHAADERVWSDHPAVTSGGLQVLPGFPLLYARKARNPPTEYDMASRDLAGRMLEEYRREGVFDRMREMAGCARAVQPLVMPADGTAIGMQLSDLGPMRRLADINAARMALAAKARDMPEFLDAFEANLALSRMLQRQAILLDAVIGYTTDTMTYREMRLLLTRHPDAATLEAIRDIMGRQRAGVARSYFFEGERLGCIDSTAWLFSDPGRVRLGRFSPGLKDFVSQFGFVVGSGTLGTYAENRDTLNFIYETAKKNAERLPADRDPLWSLNRTDLVLVRCMTSNTGVFLPMQDHHELQVSSSEILVALERFRSARGDYPDTLAELAPGFMDSLPRDPWSGKGFGYRRVDPKVDRLGRAFVLYSTGPDAKDDGGHEQSPEPGDSTTTHEGNDFIVNGARESEGP